MSFKGTPNLLELTGHQNTQLMCSASPKVVGTANKGPAWCDGGNIVATLSRTQTWCYLRRKTLADPEPLHSVAQLWAWVPRAVRGQGAEELEFTHLLGFSLRVAGRGAGTGVVESSSRSFRVAFFLSSNSASWRVILFSKPMRSNMERSASWGEEKWLHKEGHLKGSKVTPTVHARKTRLKEGVMNDEQACANTEANNEQAQVT